MPHPQRGLRPHEQAAHQLPAGQGLHYRHHRDVARRRPRLAALPRPADRRLWHPGPRRWPRSCAFSANKICRWTPTSAPTPRLCAAWVSSPASCSPPTLRKAWASRSTQATRPTLEQKLRRLNDEFRIARLLPTITSATSSFAACSTASWRARCARPGPPAMDLAAIYVHTRGQLAVACNVDPTAGLMRSNSRQVAAALESEGQSALIFRGKVNGKEARILVDSGASVSAISPTMVEQVCPLRLKCRTPTPLAACWRSRSMLAPAAASAWWRTTASRWPTRATLHHAHYAVELRRQQQDPGLEYDRRLLRRPAALHPAAAGAVRGRPGPAGAA